MAVRTKRLARGVTGAANVTVTAYTCPAGETAIVKDIRLYARLGALGSVIVALQSGSVFVNVIQRPMSAGETHSAQPYVVMSPGDQILVLTDVTDGLAFWFSGTELDGVAS